MRIFSGIDLDGVQYHAGLIYDKYRISNQMEISELALLIANLVARVKELVVNEQSFVAPLKKKS